MSCRFRDCVLGAGALAAVLVSLSQPAFARHRFHVRHAARASAAGDYAPPYASIVVDGNSGDVLYASNADALRHPASLTKIMTLYLLFERLEAGSIKLDTRLKVSRHAAEQAPTKLGLKPGDTIAVEDAIKAVVTKSANDAAVAIAEDLAGSEDEFARLMTLKAHALGMTRTTYVNASGLPDDDQVTTAHDQALLGQAIQARFPRYYRYFSTEKFVYRGRAIRNHNHLLGSVSGVDGIKTGYTRSSGFNLVASVHREGHYIVAVVFGGHSASGRDARMRELISAHIKEASLRRTAPILAERTEPRADFQAPALAQMMLPPHPSASHAASRDSAVMVGSTEPIRPVLVKTISFRAVTRQSAPLSPLPPLVPVAPRPRATVSAPQPQATAPTASRAAAAVPEAPSTVVVAAAGPPAISAATKAEPAGIDSAEIASSAAHAHARGGWILQVGAFEDEDEARQHLSMARLKIPGILAAADSFTERVQKGDKTFYRARFAGLDRAAAEAACKLLKRSDIACFTMKN